MIKKGVICCLVALLLSGCIYNQKESNKQEKPIDTSVASGYYLSLGKLKKDVVIKEKYRDENNMTISNHKIVFPQSHIQSVCMSNDVKEEQFVEVTQDDIEELYNIVENTEVLEDIAVKEKEKISEDFIGIETNLVCLTQKGEYKIIHFKTIGADYHLVRIGIDDQEEFSKYEEIDGHAEAGSNKFVCVYSSDLTDLLKKWIGWEEVTNNDFLDIQEISVLHQDQKISALDQLDTEEIKLILEKAIQVYGEMHDAKYYLKCKMSNEKYIQLGISSDGFIATEGNLYKIEDQEDVKKLIEMINGVNKLSKDKSPKS